MRQLIHYTNGVPEELQANLSLTVVMCVRHLTEVTDCHLVSPRQGQAVGCCYGQGKGCPIFLQVSFGNRLYVSHEILLWSVLVPGCSVNNFMSYF